MESKINQNIFKVVQKNAIDKILAGAGQKPVFVFIYLDTDPEIPQTLQEIVKNVPEDKGIFVKEEFGTLRLTSYGGKVDKLFAMPALMCFIGT